MGVGHQGERCPRRRWPDGPAVWGEVRAGDGHLARPSSGSCGSRWSQLQVHCCNPVLCLQPQPPLPDVLVWMLSGRRCVAWARIPAQDVLFSVVEEERARDCGKIQSLPLTVRGPVGKGAGDWRGMRLLGWHRHWGGATRCTVGVPNSLFFYL